MSEGAGITAEPTAHTAPFWAAAARHSLVLPRCPRCGVWLHPQDEVCPRGHTDLVWTAASGWGTVVAATTVHRTVHPARPAPYVLLVIRLDEGPQLISSREGDTPVAHGARVRFMCDVDP